MAADDARDARTGEKDGAAGADTEGAAAQAGVAGATGAEAGATSARGGFSALAGRMAALADTSLDLERDRAASLGRTSTTMLVCIPLLAIVEVARLFTGSGSYILGMVPFATAYLVALLLLVASFILVAVSRLRPGDSGTPDPKMLARRLDGLGGSPALAPAGAPRTGADEDVRAAQLYCESLQGAYEALRKTNQDVSATLKTSLGLLIGSIGICALLAIASFAFSLVVYGVVVL